MSQNQEATVRNSSKSSG